MIKLYIDNSICKVEGLTLPMFESLRKVLSYTPDPKAAYFAGTHGSGRRYLISKKCEFPTGLLYLVEKWCHKNSIEFVTKDVRIKPHQVARPFDMKYDFQPYPEQLEAVKQAILHNRGIITCPTGSGKSLIAALLASRFNVNTLLVVPTLELKRQLSLSLLDWFGEETMKHITVENVDALDPNKVATQDLVIIDEFHRSGAKTYRNLNKKAWKNVYYKFGLTATPFRSNENERLLLESVLSKVIYRLNYQTAVDKGYIVPMEAYYIDLPITKVKGNMWAHVYYELVVNNKVRNDIVSKILVKIRANGNSTLCLVKEIKHGKELARLTGAGFANGQDDDSSVLISGFNAGKLKTLIGTTGVLGEGIDTRPAEYVIIAGLGKSKNAFMQQVGRAMRVYPGKDTGKIIIFRDKSHKFTINHFNAQVKILKDEYNIKPVKLDL